MAQARASARSEVGTIVLGMIPGPEGMVFSHVLPLLLQRMPDCQVLLRTMTAPDAIGPCWTGRSGRGSPGPIESEDLAYEVYMREQVVVMMPESWEQARLERVPVAAWWGCRSSPSRRRWRRRCTTPPTRSSSAPG